MMLCGMSLCLLRRMQHFLFYMSRPTFFAIPLKFSHQLVDIVDFVDGVQTLVDIVLTRIYLVLWITIFCEVVATVVV